MKKLIIGLGILSCFSNTDAMNMQGYKASCISGCMQPNVAVSLVAEGCIVSIREPGENFAKAYYESSQRWILIKVEEGTTKIGELAFENLPLLNSVEIPASVKDVGDECFAECKNLSGVGFGPDSNLERIGEGAFSGSGITFLTIPAGVQEIGDVCFAGCKNLSRVEFSQAAKLECIGVGIFSKCAIESLTIPASINQLCDYCFFSCKKLSEVKFGKYSKLEHIGAKVFYHSGIALLTIPASVKDVGDECFAKCENLSRVEFRQDEQLERIGIKAFYGSGIKSLIMPASVEKISLDCCLQCSELSYIEFKEKCVLNRNDQGSFDIQYCREEDSGTGLSFRIRMLIGNCFKRDAN